MKNWKKTLCLIMAAMLACSPVSVQADESEEWETEELLQTENAELKENTEETIRGEILAGTEKVDQKEILADVQESQVEEEITEDTEEVWNAASTKQPENPVYNENTDSTKWSYVYFGRYPQNDVTGDDLDESIINANYNKNGDAVVDGVKYRRVESQDDGAYYDGQTYWMYYSYEPIKWRVLQNDGNTLLLLTDQAVYRGPRFYNEDEYSSSTYRSMLNGYSELENSRHIDYSVKGTNFLNMAFYEEEQDSMQVVPIQEIVIAP